MKSVLFALAAGAAASTAHAQQPDWGLHGPNPTIGPESARANPLAPARGPGLAPRARSTPSLAAALRRQPSTNRNGAESGASASNSPEASAPDDPAADEGGLLGAFDPSLDAELTPPDQAENLELLSPKTKRVNVYAGVDLVSQYVSRGLVFVDKPSVQPWVELDLSLSHDAAPGTPLGEISWFAGNWNNMTGQGTDRGFARTGVITSLDEWYEADLYTGIRATWFNNLQTSARFNYYFSPSGAFDEIQELDFRVSYDDSTFWSERVGLDGFTTTPKIRIAKEIRDSGGSEQWYISPQLSPSFPLDGLPFKPRLTIPLALGFGANDQYVTIDTGEQRHFGFFQTGAQIAVPINILPEDRGGLTLTGAVDVILLTDDDLSVEDDALESVVRLGLSYAF